jgi:hypothetical protein
MPRRGCSWFGLGGEPAEPAARRERNGRFRPEARHDQQDDNQDHDTDPRAERPGPQDDSSQDELAFNLLSAARAAALTGKWLDGNCELRI